MKCYVGISFINACKYNVCNRPAYLTQVYIKGKLERNQNVEVDNQFQKQKKHLVAILTFWYLFITLLVM